MRFQGFKELFCPLTLKNKKCILKNNRADTLHHFSLDLDTLTDISFEFYSDTILIPNACKYFGDSVFGFIDLIPNNKTNCLEIEYIYEINNQHYSNRDRLNNVDCKEFEFVNIESTKKNINIVYFKYMDNYEYIKLR